MRRFGWTIAALGSFGLVVYLSIFPVAEVYTEIVILRTYDAEGAPRETRLTVIDFADTAWVRGRPYRGWFARVEANPTAELYRGEAWHPVDASVSRDPADAAAFDLAMFDTYGRAYRYVDFVARLSATEVPVRLTPRTP